MTLGSGPGTVTPVSPLWLEPLSAAPLQPSPPTRPIFSDLTLLCHPVQVDCPHSNASHSWQTQHGRHARLSSHPLTILHPTVQPFTSASVHMRQSVHTHVCVRRFR